jgi:[ribosomal protein S5]-alanine N-acetyltransferase
MSTAVLLRPLEEPDLAEAHRLTNEMDVVRYMLWEPHTEEETRALIHSTQYPTRAIALAEGGELIGLTGLVLSPDRQTAEAWYMLGKAHWAQGYGTEAVRLLLDFGFGELGLHRVWATCLPENRASLRALEKAGMRREGYQRKNLRIHGEWKNSWLFAILREEWLD